MPSLLRVEKSNGMDRGESWERRPKRNKTNLYFLLVSVPVDGTSSIIFCSKYLWKSYHPWCSSHFLRRVRSVDDFGTIKYNYLGECEFQGYLNTLKVLSFELWGTNIPWYSISWAYWMNKCRWIGPPVVHKSNTQQRWHFLYIVKLSQVLGRVHREVTDSLLHFP